MLTFYTPADFDLRSLTVMGMNAKPNTDSPIGYFGTGLKYALAVLARLDCEVVFEFDGQSLALRREPSTFRGKEFEGLFLGPHQLPFTTELGKNWTALMAYRELVSNTRDEKGCIFDHYVEHDFGSGLSIYVSGEPIQDARQRHSEMFLDNPKIVEVIHPDGGFKCEISSGRSEFIYYRGVNVGRLPAPAPFTFNYLGGMSLTEDRTWNAIWMTDIHLRQTLRHARSQEILFALCSPENESNMFGKLNWLGENHLLIGKVLVDFVLARIGAGRHVPLDLAAVCLKASGKPPKRQQAKITAGMSLKLAKAKEVLEKFDCDLGPYSIEVVNRLEGAEAMAESHSKTIVLPEALFNEPLSYFVATLYEEYCHLAFSYRDESRKFQNHLLNKLGELMVELAERE